MVSFDPVGRRAHRPPSPSPDGPSTVTPIAVIGMACRLPGGIESPEQLWQALLRGDDLVTDIPADRWDADDYFDPEPGVPGRSVSRWGAFLDDIAGFDAPFFDIDEQQAAALDPQHRLLLETSWESFEHAGIPPGSVAQSRTGVFIGLTHADYQLISGPATMAGPHGFDGNGFGMASGRIAHALRVHGPAVTVDTDGSSSLLAVHLACRSLHDGESDLALAGGACVLLEPRRLAAASAQGMLSPTGRCRAFDAAADGIVPGEGAGMVLLKRLPDALRDGDRILAVVRGTATNQSGRIGTPSPQTQRDVYRKALAAAGVDPATVAMVEAHGTGSPDGDTSEFTGLATVYGVDGPCAVTSAKTNFGDTRSAAGVLGLMKAVLALRHGVVPQNLHFHRLPDALAQISTHLAVPHEPEPWPAGGGPRRAAVSAHGGSGTHVHGVLEQAPAQALTAPAPSSPALLFPLSSTSEQGLRRTAAELADWLDAHDEVALPDLAHTLARRRTHRSVRAAVVASTRAQLCAELRDLADSATTHPAAQGPADRGPVWLFPDVVSRWDGAELLAGEPVFAATVARCEPMILRECGFSVTEAISLASNGIDVRRGQPTVFTMQVALAAALRSHGARPGAVIGYSIGETAAAVVAGALSLQDGLRVVCSRANLLSRIPDDDAGAMATVALPAQQLLSEPALRGAKDVAVAAVPSPDTAVIAGAAPAVRELVAAWAERGVQAREIPTGVALHSPQVDAIVDDFAASLAGLTPMTPDVTFYTASSFDPRDQPVCDARYWVANLRKMVRFAAATRAALEDGHRVFVELAPDAVLTGALERTAEPLDIRPVTPARTGGLQEFVGRLHSAGAAVDFAALYPAGRLVDAPLPAWTRRRLWFTDDGANPTARGQYTVVVHPLLGTHLHSADDQDRHLWQGELGIDTHPWLADHQIHGTAVLSAAAYCEMALAAARAALGADAEVGDLSFDKTLTVQERTTIGAVATHRSAGAFDFVVQTHQQGQRRRHARAELRVAGPAAAPARDVAGLLAAHPIRRDGGQLRTILSRGGLAIGPAYCGLTAVRTADGQDTVLADIAPPGQVRAQQSVFGVHPALLEACFQAVAGHPGFPAVPVLPTGVKRLRAFGSARAARHCHAHITAVSADAIEADVEVLDPDGTVLIEVTGLRFAATGRHRPDDRLLTVDWQHRPLPELPHTDPGGWLIIGHPSRDPVAGELVEALESLGAHCTSMDLDAALLGGVAPGTEFAGVVVLLEPSPGPEQDGPDGAPARRVMRIANELAALPGEPARLYVVTRSAQPVRTGERCDLTQAGVPGLIRVLGNEHPDLAACHVDIDASAGTAPHLARQLLIGSDEDQSAWRDGRWYVARLTAAPLGPEDRRTAEVDPLRHGIRTQLRTPGDPKSLELVAHERISPGPGEVEVSVRAAGVTVADARAAFGGDGDAEAPDRRLGTDFAGMVTAVGVGVTELKVGDRVAGICPGGSWGTFLTCDARSAVPVPAGLSDLAAAAVVTAYATVHRGLRESARLSADDVVLIHGASGAAGPAAVAVARHAGAQIFATADTDGNRTLLRDMGVAHVYDSHSADLAAHLRRDTLGRGVDVVLNSVSGVARRAGAELLAPGGRFVEIGGQGFGGAGLPADRANLTFSAVDMAQLAGSHPGRVGAVLTEVFGSISDGTLPLPAHAVHPLADAAGAVAATDGAGHIGVPVLEIPAVGRLRVVMPAEQIQTFRPDGTYVVTGGLTDPGLLLAERMSAAGAGALVLCSRTPPSPQALARVDAIRATGTEVALESADIAEGGTAAGVVAAAARTRRPVRGVLHTEALAQTPASFDDTWAAVVLGAWNLHAATISQPLDWFCSFTSTAALAGPPGRGAEAAAGGWLDGFARWRQNAGRPATTIAWAADTATTAAGCAAFEMLLRHGRAHTAYAPSDSAWRSAIVARSPFGAALRASPRDSADAARLRTELDGLPRAQWPPRLRRMITEQVSAVVRRDIDPDRPLPESGIDSLGALELITRLETATGVRVRATEITTIRGLADLLTERLAPV
ncbi:sulfolipid-1 biosynthesis phthioceranic/hydroxyphthioceranic acid synthase [Mycobacterium sp. BMJ-28]